MRVFLLRTLRFGAPLLPAAALAACVMFGFRPALYPEPPPKGLENLPHAPGYALKTFDDPQALNAHCLANLGQAAPDDYNAGSYRACVIPQLRQEVMPSQGLLRDTDFWKAIDQHETAHEYGLVHNGDGRGWLLSAAPPPGTDPKIAAALMALPRTRPFRNGMVTDWSGVFPQSRPAAQGATVAPLPRQSDHPAVLLAKTLAGAPPPAAGAAGGAAQAPDHAALAAHILSLLKPSSPQSGMMNASPSDDLGQGEPQ